MHQEYRYYDLIGAATIVEVAKVLYRLMTRPCALALYASYCNH